MRLQPGYQKRRWYGRIGTDRYGVRQPGLYDMKNKIWRPMDAASVETIVQIDKEECGELDYSSSSNNSNNSKSHRFRNNNTFTNNSQIMARNFHQKYPSNTNDQLTLRVMGLNSIQTAREWRLWEAIQNLKRGSPGPVSYPNSPPPSPSLRHSFANNLYNSPSSDCFPPSVHTPSSQFSSTSHDTMSDSNVRLSNPFISLGPCKDGIMDKKSHKRVIDMLRILKAYKVFKNTKIDGNVLKQRSMCYQLYVTLFSF